MSENLSVPKGWAIVKLSEIIQPRGEKVSPQDFPDMPFLGMKNVEAHTSRIIATEPAKNFSSHASRFYAGDVLYGRLRPYLNKVVRPTFDGLASGEFIVLPENERVDGNFLKYRLISGDFVSFASHLNEGDRPRVNFKQIGNFELLLPPLNEQRRIVAKIEALFSELDAGVAALEQARAQLKRYRQALLKAAFEGRLTEDWRKAHAGELEPADTLLARIRAEREARWRQQLAEWEEAVRAWEAAGRPGKKPRKPRKPKDLPPLTEEELAELPELPEGWAWVRLWELTELIQIGPFGSLLHKADYVRNRIPAINPSHIKNQKIVPDYSFTVTTEKADELARYRLKKGDIIFGRRGEMGRCAVVGEKEDGWLCGTGSLFIRLLPFANPVFYSYELSSKRVKGFLENKSIGTTMQNLNQKILQEIPVPICSPDEQSELIAKLEAAFTTIDYFDQTIDQALAQAAALRQAILKKAFSGRLVPQDPNDEPASVLLERIRAEKIHR